MNEFARTERLIGSEAIARLRSSHVAVFGIGGVGSYVVEALARSGIGTLTIVDGDCVDETNINRQLIALHSTVGQPKTVVAKARISDIDPQIRVNAYQLFYTAESSFSFEGIDYIVDAVDTVSAKLALVENAYRHNIPIISSMGTGNKLDPTQFEVADIYRTSICPLARVMRRELKKRGIPRLKVVYSKEQPLPVPGDGRTPASISFVPSSAGLILAGEVIKHLAGIG